jgi:hypothetical protein
MSAWLLDFEHMDAVATIISRTAQTNRSPREIFDLLTAENVASIRARYGDDSETADQLAAAPSYVMTGGDLPPIPVNAALLALDCYGYQSCEHDGWMDSEARMLCCRARHRLLEDGGAYQFNHGLSGWPIDPTVFRLWLAGGFSERSAYLAARAAIA